MKFFQRRTDEQQREAHRVRVERSSPVIVSLRCGSMQRSDVLYDISTTGLSLSVPLDDPFTFPADDVVHCDLRLPGSGAPLHIGLVLAHDTSTGGARRIGFRFDPGATPSLSNVQELILQYVLERQWTPLDTADDGVGG